MKVRPPEWLKFLLLRQYWHRTGGVLGFAVLLGFLGGLAAALFKFTLEFVQKSVLDRFAGFPFSESGHHILPHWLFFMVPAVGGLLSGLLVYTFAPDAAGTGTDGLIDAFHNRGGHIPFRVAVVKFFASIITLGSGGSAGYEGPTAQMGGGLGSLVGRIFGLPDRVRRIMLLTGTAAGLGAIFHAPLGGALTAAEIVYREDFESQGFLPFTIASVVAFTCFSLVTHQHTTYLHFPLLPFANASELINFALVGLLCVPFSWIFVRTYRGVQAYAESLRMPNYLKPAVGGLLVGLLAYACPQAAGTNWSYLSDAVSGSFAFHSLLFIACAKILATSLTIGSGGSGGVFGPSLFIGGMLGGAVGFGLQALHASWVTNPGSYVLVGMGAFFAGAAKAPLAGLIMVCEITGNYGLLPPLLIASTLHLALSRKWSLYSSQRHDKFSSPVHEHALKVDVLKNIPLHVVFQRDGDMPILHPDWKIKEAFVKIGASDCEVFPVVDEYGKLAGLVSAASLHMAAAESSPENLVLIGDLMTDDYTLTTEMDLRSALSVFLESRAVQLPVVDAGGNILGMLRLHDIMTQYDRLTKPRDGSSVLAGKSIPFPVE
ncbi:MAG: chloride channel protein [Fibrobacteres bacterium]|nr:chloride channel protein [Fibrobacterota bacterium]